MARTETVTVLFTDLVGSTVLANGCARRTSNCLIIAT